MSIKRRALAAVALAVAFATVNTVVATPAQALDRRMVCAQDVWVRPGPGAGPIAILYRGETFDLATTAVHNGFLWAYGFAWGGENVYGWLPYNTITNNAGSCQPPYA